MSQSPKIVVIGAGPTGLGAAWRMEELGHHNWELYEASDHPGGLASSFVDKQGFTWDIGGHVLFSHYRYFDNLMQVALGDDWIEHLREAWVWIRNRWVPYPFQNNIWRLPQDDLLACMNGLLDLRDQSGSPEGGVKTFEDWLLRSFGVGLCNTFMFPYNQKVWAYPPNMMDVGWMGERVATVDIRRVLRNIVCREDDVSWGPNSMFRFPKQGGTGAIWKSIHGKLPQERIHLGSQVIAVDALARTIRLSDGRAINYDKLISTLPLDVLLQLLVNPLGLSGYSESFRHSSTHIVGVGIEGRPPPDLRTKAWMYFPEPETPFYRVTVFSNYSPNNVPEPGRQWSLMAEISESSHKPVNPETVSDETIQGLRKCGFIQESDSIVSIWHHRMEHGYPTPWLGRDQVLDAVSGVLTEHNIFSRGRFGTWKYEVSNQDHSVMQGVEVVGRLLQGTEEHTFKGDMRDELDPVKR